MGGSGTWLLEPVGRCTDLVIEAFKVAGVLHRASASLANLGPLLDAARSVLESKGGPTAGIDALRAQQPLLEQFLAELSISEPFGPVDRQAVIMMWVALEVGVEDTARAIIERDSESVQRLVNEGIVPRKAAPAAGTEADPYKIYRKLEKSAQNAVPPGRVGEQFCMVLAHVGLHLELKRDTPDVLAEMNYVRNCLLHRGGIAEDMALRHASALGPVPGERLVVGEERLKDYTEAASDFAGALLRAAVGSRYISVQE